MSHRRSITVTGVPAAVALVLSACGTTTTSSPSEGAASVGSSPVVVVESPAPVDLVAAATQPASPTPVDSSNTELVAPSTTAEAVTEPPPDPDADPDPDPSAPPAGIVPIDPLTAPGDPVGPQPFPTHPFTQVLVDTLIVTTPVDPPPFEPVPLTADLDTLTPLGGLDLAAATGCASGCIADAQISNIGGASTNYDLHVETDLWGATPYVEAFLSGAPIVRNDNGRYIAPTSEPTAEGAAHNDVWDHSFDLEPSMTYHLLVRARDEQGVSEVVGTFTTRDAIGPDTLATPRPCDTGCLADIAIAADPAGTGLTISMVSEAAVVVEVAHAVGHVVQGAGGPTLDDASTTTYELAAGDRLSAHVGGLVPNAAYSSIVSATDSLGGVDRWVATVATSSPTISAGIDRVHISGDGDDGRRNRGEIDFLFGTGDDYWGYVDLGKTASNTTHRLGRDSAGPLVADAGGNYPWIGVVAGEDDGVRLGTCFVAANPDGDWRPETETWCGNRRSLHSQTHSPSMTLAEIKQLPSCEPFDVGNPAADHCAWVHTSPNSPEQVSFDAIIWYDIDPGE